MELSGALGGVQARAREFRDMHGIEKQCHGRNANTRHGVPTKCAEVKGSAMGGVQAHATEFQDMHGIAEQRPEMPFLGVEPRAF